MDDDVAPGKYKSFPYDTAVFAPQEDVTGRLRMDKEDGIERLD